MIVARYTYTHSNTLKTETPQVVDVSVLGSRISHFNMYDTRPYYIWASMRSRCDSTDKEYNKRYGVEVYYISRVLEGF